MHTNADGVTVIPPADSATSGVEIVDAEGKVITSAVDGSRLYFDVPEDSTDGSAALTVQASTTVPVGRAFASETRSQTQILAGFQRVDGLRDGDRHLGHGRRDTRAVSREELRQGRR